MTKIKNPVELQKRVEELQRVIVFSRRKSEIVEAFKQLICIASSECVDLNLREKDSWAGIDFVYEYVRCFFPTRFFQLAKEIHHGSRWSYVRPLYRELFHLVYEDISADTNKTSNGTLESQKCTSKLRNEFLIEADRELGKVLDEQNAWKMEMQKRMCRIRDLVEKSLVEKTQNNKDSASAQEKKQRSAKKATGDK